MVDKYIKSNICALPWTGLEVGVNGGAAPCCLYKGQVPDVKVYKNNLKDIQKSQYMENLRQQFKNGERHGQGTYTYTNGSKYAGEFKRASVVSFPPPTPVGVANIGECDGGLSLRTLRGRLIYYQTRNSINLNGLSETSRNSQH